MSVVLTNTEDTTFESGAAIAHDGLTLNHTHREEEEGTDNLTLQIMLRTGECVVMGICLVSASAMPVLEVVPLRENHQFAILARFHHPAQQGVKEARVRK